MVIPGRFEDYQELNPKGHPWDLYMESGICHEYGHLLAATLKLWSGTAWVDEWSAHVFVAAYQKHIGRQPLSPSDPERYTSLSDLHYLDIDVGNRNYVWFYFHLWGLAAEYIDAVGFKNAVKRLQTEFPADRQTRNSLSSAMFARVERVWPGFRNVAGSLAGPPTLQAVSLRRCDSERSVVNNRTVTLVVENRGTMPVTAVSPSGPNLEVASGAWAKRQYRVGEQVRIGESCVTVADQHTLAVIGETH